MDEERGHDNVGLQISGITSLNVPAWYCSWVNINSCAGIYEIKNKKKHRYTSGVLVFFSFNRKKCNGNNLRKKCYENWTIYVT